LFGCSDGYRYYTHIKCYDNGKIVIDENVREVYRNLEGFLGSGGVSLTVRRFDNSYYEISTSMKCTYSEHRKPINNEEF
jgi:hypothetical protein